MVCGKGEGLWKEKKRWVGEGKKLSVSKYRCKLIKKGI